MGAPATQGRLCTKLEEMEIGDYIKCDYLADTANVAGIFSNLGTSISEVELSIIAPTTIPNGYFYFLKVDKGLLIADRMIQDQISWAALNSKNYVFGKKSERYLYRLPALAEYKKYITESDLNGNIIKRDTNVWHKPTKPTLRHEIYNPYGRINYDLVVFDNYDSGALITNCEWVEDNSGSTARIIHRIDLVTYNAQINAYDTLRGARLPCFVNKNLAISDSLYGGDAIIEAGIAFRPVIEYIDNKKSKTIWY